MNSIHTKKLIHLIVVQIEHQIWLVFDHIKVNVSTHINIDLKIIKNKNI